MKVFIVDILLPQTELSPCAHFFFVYIFNLLHIVFIKCNFFEKSVKPIQDLSRNELFGLAGSMLLEDRPNALLRLSRVRRLQYYHMPPNRYFQ